MYILAIGYDSLRRRSKRCDNSLNSRNFQLAKGVYARPLIADGFLYDSYLAVRIAQQQKEKHEPRNIGRTST